MNIWSNGSISDGKAKEKHGLGRGGAPPSACRGVTSPKIWKLQFRLT